MIQAVTLQYRYISNHFPFKVNELCSDNTMIWLNIVPVLLFSKLWTMCIASTTWQTTTDQTNLVNNQHDLCSRNCIITRPSRITPIPLLSWILIEIWMSMKKISRKYVSMTRKYRNHRLKTNPQDSGEEPQSTKSHKTSMERYVHYTDITRSGNTIKQQPSDLCTWILLRSIFFSTYPAP